MSCTALVIDTGPFTNGLFWENTASKPLSGNRKVEWTANGITVFKGAQSNFYQTLANRTNKYMVLGSLQFVLILDREIGAGGCSVSVVDFTGSTPNFVPLGTVNISGIGVGNPQISHSANTGTAFFMAMPTGTNPNLDTFQKIQICRSDNGAVLCSASPELQSKQLSAEASTTAVLIKQGGTTLATGLFPAGSCQVSPNSQNFPDAILGGAANLAKTTATFTLSNNGNDCLQISGITPVAPFSLKASSVPLPNSLAPGQSMTVTIEFAPTTLGTFGPTDLPIVCSPPNGVQKLSCKGKARQPVKQVSATPASLGYGKVPINPVAPGIKKSVVLKNTGEVDVTITAAAGAGANAFTWGGLAATPLAVGASLPAIDVFFLPTAVGTFHDEIHVNEGGNLLTKINLDGVGCAPNAKIDVPPIAPINFGQLEKGFRTVRTLLVKNPGEAPLHFDADISGPDASLFGLQLDGSITNVQGHQPYTIDPVSPCGALASGSGKQVVGVAFFADPTHAMGNVSATLTLTPQNATNVAPGTTFVFPLSGEITPPNAIDVGLVLDRSGSMADPSGSRSKSEAEISAAKLFVELMRTDGTDRLSITRFNNAPDVLFGMADMDATTQQNAKGRINSTDLLPQGSTCIAGGVLVSQKDLGSLAPRNPAPPAPPRRSMVVLTDGIDNTPYLNPDDNKVYSVLGGFDMGTFQNTDPVNLSGSDIKLYAVGLGNDISIPQLEALSSTTGGYFLPVKDLSGQNFFDLEKYFTQIFMGVTQNVPIKDPMYTINPSETQSIEFNILRGDSRILVVMYDFPGKRLPFWLESPQGEIIDITHVPPPFQLRANAAPTARFMEVHLPVNDPDKYAGMWKVVIQHSGQVCTVRGDKRGNDFATHAVDNPALHWGFVSSCKPSNDPVQYGIAIGAGSNFRMFPFVPPNSLKVGDPMLLSAIVEEAGLRIPGCDVTAEVKSPSGSVWNLKLWDDGAHSDGAGNDGEYANTFTHTAEQGFYLVTFRASGKSGDGEPVFREEQRSKYVEGTVPVKNPPNRPTDGGSGTPTTRRDCCSRITRLIWLGLIVLVLILLVLLKH
jgi:von Willebrand factor type A domain